MEFIWIIDEELNSYIFTSILFNNYLAPKGFDFDYRENHKWGGKNKNIIFLQKLIFY